LLRTALVALFAASILPAGAPCRAEEFDGFHYHFDNVMTSVREATTPKNLLMASGVVMLVGREQERAAVQDCLKAAAVAEVAVGSLKYATNRKRPVGTHSRLNSAFPSSHAAASFALATCISRAYPRLTAPSYALASTVAFSRVYHRRHHMTDVVAGSLIGVAAARLTESRFSNLKLDLGWLRPHSSHDADHRYEGELVYRVYISTDF
jgi:membrane-associated phospholipid phosphatase